MACLDKGPDGASRIHRVTVLAAEAEEICWICLDGPSAERPLVQPCRCPSMVVHARCLARWQLQSAGTRRERLCDFCACELPDWKSVLTPSAPTTPSAPAVMNVNFDGKTYSFHVAPGADGYRQFTEAIRKAFSLPDDSELNITFTCDEPSTAGSLLTLSGPGAYDAAVHCASVSAARRSSISSPDSSSSTAAGAAAGGDGEAPDGAADGAAAGASRDSSNAGSAAAAASEEVPQEPPTTPRLADRQRWQQHHQLEQQQPASMARPGTAGSSSGSSTAGSSSSSAETRLQRLAVEHLLQEDADAASVSSGSNVGGGGGSSSRSSSRGRMGERIIGSCVRSLAHSRSSSGASLARDSGGLLPAGCVLGPSGGGSNIMLAEANRSQQQQRGARSNLSRGSSFGGGASSGSSSAGGGSSASRRSSGFGRKLRDALAELLTSK